MNKEVDYQKATLYSNNQESKIGNNVNYKTTEDQYQNTSSERTTKTRPKFTFCEAYSIQSMAFHSILVMDIFWNWKKYNDNGKSDYSRFSTFDIVCYVLGSFLVLFGLVCSIAFLMFRSYIKECFEIENTESLFKLKYYIKKGLNLFQTIMMFYELAVNLFIFNEKRNETEELIVWWYSLSLFKILLCNPMEISSAIISVGVDILICQKYNTFNFKFGLIIAIDLVMLLNVFVLKKQVKDTSKLQRTMSLEDAQWETIQFFLNEDMTEGVQDTLVERSTMQELIYSRHKIQKQKETKQIKNPKNKIDEENRIYENKKDNSQFSNSEGESTELKKKYADLKIKYEKLEATHRQKFISNSYNFINRDMNNITPMVNNENFRDQFNTAFNLSEFNNRREAPESDGVPSNTNISIEDSDDYNEQEIINKLKLNFKNKIKANDYDRSSSKFQSDMEPYENQKYLAKCNTLNSLTSENFLSSDSDFQNSLKYYTNNSISSQDNLTQFKLPTINLSDKSKSSINDAINSKKLFKENYEFLSKKNQICDKYNTLSSMDKEQRMPGQSFFIEILSNIEEGIIIVNKNMTHIYNNIAPLMKKSANYNLFDKIFNPEMLSREVQVEKLFTDFETLYVIADLKNLRKLFQFYDYVYSKYNNYSYFTKNFKNLMVSRKLFDTLKLKKEIPKNLDNENDVNFDSDKSYKEKIYIKELINLLKIYMKVYCEKTENKSDQYIDAKNINTKRLDNFSISFFYNQIQFTINFYGSENNPIASIVLMNLWERYMLLNIEEKNRFFALILKSIDHESKTPLNLVLNMTEAHYEKSIIKKKQVKTTITDLSRVIDSREELDLEVYKKQLVNAKTVLSKYVKDFSIEKRQFKQILSHSKMLEFVIMGFMDFSNILTNNMLINVSTFNLYEALEEVVSLFVETAREKNLKLEVDINNETKNIEWSTDRDRLQIIVFTLLHNSFKYTFEGNVILTVMYCKNTCQINITVSDTGCGIKEDDLAIVKKALIDHLSPIKTRNSSGIGLGLRQVAQLLKYLCRHKFNLLNIKSKYNEGCAVEFFLSSMNQQKNELINQRTEKLGIDIQMNILGDIIDKYDVENHHCNNMNTEEIQDWENVNNCMNQSKFGYTTSNKSMNKNSFRNSRNLYIKNQQSENDLLKVEKNNSSDKVKKNESFPNEIGIETDVMKENKFSSDVDDLLQITSVQSFKNLRNRYRSNDIKKKNTFVNNIEKTNHIDYYNSEEIIQEENHEDSVFNDNYSESSKSDLDYNVSDSKETIDKHIENQVKICDNLLKTKETSKAINLTNNTLQKTNSKEKIPKHPNSQNSKIVFNDVSHYHKALTAVSKKSINNLESKKIDGSQLNHTPPNESLKCIANTDFQASFCKSDISLNQSSNKMVDEYLLNHSGCKCNRILVVDDEIFNIRAAKLIINRIDPTVEIDSAHDGSVAVDLVKKFYKDQNRCLNCPHYLFVLMDVNMVNIDGTEATRQIKEYIIAYQKTNRASIITNTSCTNNAQPAKNDIVIIGCSAYSDFKTKATCINSGMKYFITKPLTRYKILNVLKQEQLVWPIIK